MKVLFQNRMDAFEKWGGDTTQMLETKKCLEKLGVNIDINLESNPNLNEYDLVHIFNIQRADYGLKQLLNAKEHNLPVALSTIYWDLRYAHNAKETHLYSENLMVRLLSKINTNIPHLGSKILEYRKNRELTKNIKTMLQEADILLPNSYSELEILAILFDAPEVRGKSVIIPNSVSISKFYEMGNNKIDSSVKLPSNYILEVGRVETWKGQLNLIKALFDYPEIPLVFIGNIDSFYAKECIKLGEKRGNCYFLGEISHEEVYYYYLNAKVHALPSLRESPGLSTLESALFETNCVVSIHAPINEYFGLNAFVCDPLVIDSIKQAVLNAWESPINNKLKKRVLENFTWEKTAFKTFEAYKKLK